MADPERGEVWRIDLGFSAKTRPCLALSTAPLDSERKLATVIPHTTSVTGTRFEVPIPATFLRNGVFDAPQPTTLAVTRTKSLKKLGQLTTDELQMVEDAVRRWLGL